MSAAKMKPFRGLSEDEWQMELNNYYSPDNEDEFNAHLERLSRMSPSQKKRYSKLLDERENRAYEDAMTALGRI